MRILLLHGSLALVTLTTAAAFAQDDSSDKLEKLVTDYFDTCMKDWDASTHMTKQEWASTCRRLADERAKFRFKYEDQLKPKEK